MDAFSWRGAKVFMVGIKGSGLSSLADLLSSCGAQVRGSDSAEHFYTEQRLRELHIPIIGYDCPLADIDEYDFAIYSAAYDPSDHPHIRALREGGVQLYSYPQFLGLISTRMRTVAISGVHGKTTISGMAATIAQQSGWPVLSVCGGQINSLGDRAVYCGGEELFMVEACEYRRHFFEIHPHALMVSAIESDHQDYFHGYDDIFAAFYEYAGRLPSGGALVYCADDRGAADLGRRMRTERNDIAIYGYGYAADAEYRIVDREQGEGWHRVRINRWMDAPITIRVPGAHNALNAVGALAILHVCSAHGASIEFNIGIARHAIEQYSGARRRCQHIGSFNNILIYDDYAHHPTSLQATIRGLREFYPRHRIIADFMSHTYSRTYALRNQFSRSFDDADIVYCHDIYPSAREASRRGARISGRSLARRIAKCHRDVRYYGRYAEALQDCLHELRPGDLFVTLGAGDNWQLGRMIADAYTRRDASAP